MENLTKSLTWSADCSSYRWHVRCFLGLNIALFSSHFCLVSGLLRVWRAFKSTVNSKLMPEIDLLSHKLGCSTYTSFSRFLVSLLTLCGQPWVTYTFSNSTYLSTRAAYKYQINRLETADVAFNSYLYRINKICDDINLHIFSEWYFGIK